MLPGVYVSRNYGTCRKAASEQMAGNGTGEARFFIRVLGMVNHKLKSVPLLHGRYMRVKLLLITTLFLAASSSLAQSPVQEIGEEKEPELRAELVRMVTEDQQARGDFDRYRRSHGLLFIDNKTLNEKLDADPVMKKELLELGNRMTNGDKARAARLKEIITTYGWPGRSLVGYEAAASAYLLIAHAVFDLPFQKMALEQMKKLPPCEVENMHLASLTDRIRLAENKKQLYGMMFEMKDGTLVPKPIEDEANVDKRRAALGMQPLAEYLRRTMQRRGMVKKE